MSGARYDVIVLGTGGVGSAALWHAARRTNRVLGLDRFPAAHDRGSSHGQTRIIRQAYFEHPDYVPLLLRAYQAWAELESLCGEQLYHCTGLLEAGPADGEVAPGVLEADRRHQLGVKTLDAADAAKRFPALRLDPSWLVVFEPQAGYLRVERCVERYLQAAVQLGAEHQTGVAVSQWRAEPDGFAVRVGEQWLRTERLIVTAGAWLPDMLGDALPPLQILRKHLHWFEAEGPQWQPPACPAYLFETAGGCFYGFPNCEPRGIKVAEHSGGDPIDDPLNDPREIDPGERGRVERFMKDHLVLPVRTHKAHTTCFYTCTPDHHFLVDRHPEHERLVFAGGLSGHGFKFAPVLGEALVQLAFDGGSTLPIEFLRRDRFDVA